MPAMTANVLRLSSGLASTSAPTMMLKTPSPTGSHQSPPSSTDPLWARINSPVGHQVISVSRTSNWLRR